MSWSDDWDDYIDNFYKKSEKTTSEKKEVDKNFCSCYNKDNIVESHICVSRLPTEKDKFLYCRTCKKEAKK